ncbi:MAG: AAA family ATPase [Myxococcales bacterium]|nr:AAA family ATPase [Myxococcales bacterium]
MLTRLHVRGYKALETLTATFEPLTVVAGPNGCGKTSLLDSILMVRDFVMLDAKTARAAHPFEEVRSNGGKPAAAIGAELWAKLSQRSQDLIQESAEYQGQVDALSEPRGGHALRAWLEYSSDERPSVAAKFVPAFAGQELQQEIIDSCLGEIRRLDLDLNVIRRPSYSPRVIPHMTSSGDGLASVLSWLQGEQPDKFELIQEQLRELVPEVKRIRIGRASVMWSDPSVPAERAAPREMIGDQVIFDFQHARGVVAKHASEGILLLLGLLTTMNTESVSVLLLDHFERSLHPQSQRHLVQYLRGISEGGIQVVVTSPSPFFLPHFQPSEIRAMVATEGGAWMGKLSSLARRPEYGRWEDEMSPSELRGVLGEGWLQKIQAGESST